MSILKQQVNSSSDFSSFFIVITHNSSINFWLINLLLWEKDPMKVPTLTLSSVLMKICQIPHVISQTASQFFFKFCMTFHCYEIYLLCTFLGQTLYILHKRTNQSAIFLDFLILGSKFTKFLSFL